MNRTRPLRTHGIQASAEALVEQLPDLALLMRRDGTILAHVGGAAVPALRPRDVEGVLRLGVSDASFVIIRQALRRCLADRTLVETSFQEGTQTFSLRVVPQAPDRALVVIATAGTAASAAVNDTTGEHAYHRLDRRGFVRRVEELVSVAELRESSFAVAVLQIDGIPDVAEVIAASVSEQLLNLALLRLAAQRGERNESTPHWHLGVIGENLLGLAIEAADRDGVESCVGKICRSLRDPIVAGDSEFRLTPHAGVAILNPGTSLAARQLIDHARVAAAEARQSPVSGIVFFGDTVRLRSLARLDLGRELREAIDARQINFNYVGRYELQTRRLVAQVGYLRWQHPLRGELRPHEFLRVAGSTGTALMLSRAALNLLCEDFSDVGKRWSHDLRVSFGPLREHLLHDDFVADIERVLFDGLIPAERLEIRIAERNLVARDMQQLRKLQRRGVQFIIDETGRSMSSLTALARAPVAGLQIDRAFVAAACTDAAAGKVCRASVGMATAFNLMSIANGIDSAAHYEALLQMGCGFGSGDFFAAG